MITRNTTYKEIFLLPELQDLKNFLFCISYDEIKRDAIDKTISEDLPEAWNADDIAYGIQHIYELKKQGVPMLQKIYTEEELKQDESRRQTGLLWFPSKTPGPFALICAGGGYSLVASEQEAYPVAAYLNEKGISAFVLKYRTSVEKAAYKAEEDLHAAINTIMRKRDIFHVSDNFAIIGFSSGAHLVSEYGTINRGYAHFGLPKPEMIALAYPAINLDYRSEMMDEIVETMLGKNRTPELKDEFTICNHMDSGYPRTYLWQTLEDETIPYELNYKQMLSKLEENQIEHIGKTVMHGMHGLGLGSGSEAEGWLDEAIDFWLKRTGD